MSRNVISELRGHDPARRARLEAVDPGALVALREGITMTDREIGDTWSAARATSGPSTPKRAQRLKRRGVVVGGLAVLAAGGGVAFAASDIWSDEEGAATNPMGVYCLEVFDVDGSGEGSAMASTMTGDPIADCEITRAEQGLAPLVDPVAFILDGAAYVTPRGEVPPGADIQHVDVAMAATIRELDASLQDVVDGGWAQCLSADEAPAWIEEELARLGLTGWSIEVEDAVDSDPDTPTPCAELVIGEKPQTVQVLPEAKWLVEGWLDADELAAYRTIATSCMSVDEAYDAAVIAVGDQPHDPVLRVVDETASCSRINVEVRGGPGTQVTVYGPTSVG